MRTDDRSNVGVLTEFQRLFAFDVSDSPELSLLDVSLHLTWTPIAARLARFAFIDRPLNETVR